MTDETPAAPDDGPAQAFIARCYDETAALLVDARDYLADRAASDAADLSMPVRIQLTQELTTMTRRLTEAMSWLLLRRAIAAGELSLDQARGHDSFELSAEPALTGADPDRLDALPLGARSLVDRSRRLYAQLSRLKASLDSALG
jgi:regulator of CtrA degradation